MNLRGDLLTYLFDKGGAFADLKVPFKKNLLSNTSRNNFRSVLSSLNNDGLITVSNKDYRGICNKIGTTLIPINKFKITAKITQKGIDAYLQDQRVAEEANNKLKSSMGKDEIIKTDKLLRVLYLKNHQSWYEVYTQAGVEKNEADFLYNLPKADGYITTAYKGDGSVDSHVVALTDKGISFFARTNYENELLNKKENQPSVTHNYNGPVVKAKGDIRGNIIGRDNKVESVSGTEKQKKWYLEYLKEIIVGLIVAGILAYLKLS